MRGGVAVQDGALQPQSLLQDPNVSAAIQSALQPKFIPYYVIAIGLVTEIARRRTAGAHDPEKWEPVFGKDHAQTKE